jgi:hypothetical protein
MPIAKINASQATPPGSTVPNYIVVKPLELSTLINRITTLENYIEALIQTYEIRDASGNVMTFNDFKPK